MPRPRRAPVPPSVTRRRLLPASMVDRAPRAPLPSVRDTCAASPAPQPSAPGHARWLDPRKPRRKDVLPVLRDPPQTARLRGGLHRSLLHARRDLPPAGPGSRRLGLRPDRPAAEHRLRLGGRRALVGGYRAGALDGPADRVVPRLGRPGRHDPILRGTQRRRARGRPVPRGAPRPGVRRGAGDLHGRGDRGAVGTGRAGLASSLRDRG